MRCGHKLVLSNGRLTRHACACSNVAMVAMQIRWFIRVNNSLLRENISLNNKLMTVGYLIGGKDSIIGGTICNTREKWTGLYWIFNDPFLFSINIMNKQGENHLLHVLLQWKKAYIYIYICEYIFIQRS